MQPSSSSSSRQRTKHEVQQHKEAEIPSNCCRNCCRYCCCNFHGCQVMEENFRLKLQLVEKGEALRRAAADAAGLQAGLASRAALHSLEAKNQVLLQVRLAGWLGVRCTLRNCSCSCRAQV